MIPNTPIFRKFAKIEPYMLAAVVLLVGVGAFGLGRLSAATEGPVALRVLYPEAKLAQPLASTAAVAQAAKAAPAPSAVQGSGAYVASKNGSKYYLVSCSGANRIKPENKVYFGSKAEAQAAGYGPAANCPGL
jgi:hypothetical protein